MFNRCGWKRNKASADLIHTYLNIIDLHLFGYIIILRCEIRWNRTLCCSMFNGGKGAIARIHNPFLGKSSYLFAQNSFKFKVFPEMCKNNKEITFYLYSFSSWTLSAFPNNLKSTLIPTWRNTPDFYLKKMFSQNSQLLTGIDVL